MSRGSYIYGNLMTISPTFALQAHTLLEKGRVEEAIALCERGLEIYPDYATAYSILAQAYERMENSGRANDVLERGIRRLPLERSLLRMKTVKGNNRSIPSSLSSGMPSHTIEKTENITAPAFVTVPESPKDDFEMREDRRQEEEIQEAGRLEDRRQEEEVREVESKEDGIQEDRRQEVEMQEPEIELPEHQEPEIELPEPGKPEIQEPEPEIELPEHQEPEIKEPEQEPEIELPEPGVHNEPVSNNIKPIGGNGMLHSLSLRPNSDDSSASGSAAPRHSHLRIIESADTTEMPSLIWRSRNVRLIPGLEFTPLRFESKKDKLYRPAYRIPDPPPFPEFEVAKKKAIRFQQRPDDSRTALTPLEELARRLEAARIPRVEEEDSHPLPPPTAPRAEQSSPMITETMAKIYEMQGAISEAVKAYEALARQKPEMAEQYTKKVRDLKNKL